MMRKLRHQIAIRNKKLSSYLLIDNLISSQLKVRSVALSRKFSEFLIER